MKNTPFKRGLLVATASVMILGPAVQAYAQDRPTREER